MYKSEFDSLARFDFHHIGYACKSNPGLGQGYWIRDRDFFLIVLGTLLGLPLVRGDQVLLLVLYRISFGGITAEFAPVSGQISQGGGIEMQKREYKAEQK